MGIVLLHENEDVYLAMYDGEVLNVDTFKMTQSRNLLRSQNYAMIKLCLKIDDYSFTVLK